MKINEEQKMECSISRREFFVVQYPGIVKDDQKALQCLGGLQSLIKSFNSSTRRLRLTYRPDMVFAKPVYGDPHSKTAIIINAKHLKNIRTGETKFALDIMGTASRVYTFSAMFDFQYGPFDKIPRELCDPGHPDNFQVFYNDLLVKESTRVLDTHLRNPHIPLYLPPLLFTRLDQPNMYCFSSRFRMKEYVELENISQQHPYHRKERKSYAMFVNFGDPVPMAAHPAALQAVTNLGTHTRMLAHDVEKLFLRRPIWGKAALVHSLNWKRVRECAIKTILPAYAYYVPNGPWGRVWVRFGYNPCSDSSSRIYQTVDYRVRSPRLQAKLFTMGRRPRMEQSDLDSDEENEAMVAIVGSDSAEGAEECVSSQDASRLDASLVALRTGQTSSVFSGSDRNTGAFRFSKTSWPDARQILYQLIDIDVPEVAEMLAAPVSRAICDPVHGWMPVDYQKTIRELMTRYLESWVLGNSVASEL